MGNIGIQKTYLRIAALGLLMVMLPLIGYTQSKRAFMVGISNYSSNQLLADGKGWNDIHGENDVKLLAPTLKKQGFTIQKLCNKEATANNIRKSLASFSAKCKSGDIVYLHFSCHGQPFEDYDGDENDGWDEALVPFDALKEYHQGNYTGENHITDDELNGYLKTIRKKIGPKGFVYVVIDACHAGSSYRGDEEEDGVIIRGTNCGFSKSGKPFAPPINEESKRSKIKIDKNADIANICILEACRSYERNREVQDNANYFGSLSYYINKALQSARLDKSISWTERVVWFMKQDVRLVQNPVIETSL
jgi:hypothetical protein